MSDSDEKKSSKESGSGDEESESESKKSGSESSNQSKKSDESGSEEESDEKSDEEEEDDEDDDDEKDEENNKNKSKKIIKLQDVKFEERPPTFSQIMSTLKSINFDLDQTTRTIDVIEKRYAQKKREPVIKNISEKEQKQLLDKIKKQLNEKESDEEEKKEDQDSQRPRNYHPPESPVRRIYENGIDITSDQLNSSQNQKFYNPNQDQHLQAFQQLNPSQYQMQNNLKVLSSLNYGYLGNTMLGLPPYQNIKSNIPSLYNNQNLAYQNNIQYQIPPPRSAMILPGDQSRFINRGSSLERQPLSQPPKTYSDFYRTQSHILNQNPIGQNEFKISSAGQSQGFVMKNSQAQSQMGMQNQRQQLNFLEKNVNIEARRNSGQQSRMSDTNKNAGIQQAIDTLLQ